MPNDCGAGARYVSCWCKAPRHGYSAPVRASGEELQEPSPGVAQLASPYKADKDNDGCERDSNSPEEPLLAGHVAYIAGVHVEKPGDERQR